jgi:Protein of unknown function (DUF2752)
MTNEVMNRRLSVVAIWFLIATGTAYLFVFEPGKTGFFPLCPFRALTGFTCPGCGSTRALHQLLHGHFAAAFELNPLFLISLPFFFVVLVRHTSFIMRGKVPRGNVLPAGVIYALFAIILTFWIFRNTPLYPFVS